MIGDPRSGFKYKGHIPGFAEKGTFLISRLRSSGEIRNVPFSGTRSRDGEIEINRIQ
jgi:hypothetical protein